MKFLPFSFACLTGSILSVSAVVQSSAAEATTDPVGFITLNVAGSSTPGTPTFSLISPTLTKPVIWQGLVTDVSSVGNSTTITVAAVTGPPAGPWTANQFNGASGTHYVEVSSSSKAGAIVDIATTTTNTLVTAQNVSTHVAVGDTIRIRKHVTIGDIFGVNNTYNLLSTDDASTADQVIVYNGATPQTYFYYIGDNFGTPAGWYDLNGTSSASAVVGPNDGIVIRRKATGNKSIVFAGSVKTGDTKIPIVPGLNVLGNVSASGLTFDNSGLYQPGNTALAPSDDASTADQVILYNNTVAQTFFRYVGDAQTPAGWYTTNGDPAGSMAIPAGASLIVRRKNGGAFNWILPSPSSF